MAFWFLFSQWFNYSSALAPNTAATEKRDNILKISFWKLNRYCEDPAQRTD